MKKKVVFLLFILFNVWSISTVEASEPASELTFNQNGFEVIVNTDKDEYKKDENIVLNLTIKNKNNFSVNNIAINSIIPDTLKFKEDIPDVIIDELKPNEVYSLSNPIIIESELLELETNKGTIGNGSTEIKQENLLKSKNNSTNISDSLLKENNKQLVLTNAKQLYGLNSLNNQTNNHIALSNNFNKNSSSLKNMPTSKSNSTETTAGIDDNKKTKEESNENNKDKNKNKVSKGIVVFSFIVITGGVVFLIYNRKTRKVVIILLSVLTPLSQTGIFTVEASEKERKTFDVYTDVSIENTKYELGFKIEYDKPDEYVQEELDPSIAIQINESTTDEVIKVREAKTTLTGLVDSKDTITAITATYYSNVDKKMKKFNIDGLSNWTINEIPLEIGTNFITITAYTSNGNYNQKEVLVNRLSTTLELADNVIPIDPKDEKGLQKIKNISDSILESWVSDNGTVEDMSDDSLNLLVENDNPILKDIHNATIKEGDIIYIPANEYFFNGLSISYQTHDDIGNTYGYSPDDTEVIHAYQSSIADLIEGEISISADSIDYSDPVDYIIAPENSTVKIGNQSVTIPPEDTNVKVNNNRRSSQNNSSKKSMSAVFKPKITLQDDNDLDISLILEGQVLMEQESDSNTKEGQISMDGEFAYSNYDVDFGIERNTIFGLPEQIKAQTSHTYSGNYSFNSSLSISSEGELIKKIAEKYGLEDPKFQFGNFSMMGLDLEDTIVLGAIGLNLVTGTVTTQNGVFSNPLDINAVALIMLDVNGEIRTTVTVQKEQSSYIEKGINVQKNGFEGSYGTVEENKGTNNKQNGDYWFQTTNIEAKSSAEKDQYPLSKTTISLDGEGSLGVQASGGLGVTLLGTLPVALRAGIGTRFDGALQGKVSFSDKGETDFTGNGSLKVDIYTKERFDAAVHFEKNNIMVGIEATIGPLEQKLWSKSFEFGEKAGDFTGNVYTTDLDQDITNNQAISNAKISLEPYDAFSEDTSYELKTNEQGEFKFESLPFGKYKLIIEHNDHKRYVLEDFDYQSDTEEKYYLDKESHPITLEGKITIADADLNSENNTPLTNVDVKLQKKFASNTEKVTVQTNENGEYIFSDLTPGIYELTINKQGFLETKGMVVVGITGLTKVSNYVMEAISNEDAGIGTVSGEITDAFTGETALGDFKLEFREGYNYENAEPTKEIITNSAEYNIELPAGIYTVYATPLTSNGVKYQADTFFIKVLGNKIIENQNGKVTPILEKDQIRVVLTWGETPRDLDSHLTAELDNNEQFQIYFRNKNKMINERSYYKLDVDDTSQFGPETTTLSSPVDGKYTFSVFNYTDGNKQELKNSGAMVKVYFSDQVNPFIFYVPNLDGNAWDVFEYNVTTDTFKVLNKVYTTSSSAVGPIVNYQNSRRVLKNTETDKSKEEYNQEDETEKDNDEDAE